jgi:hypothetical protein
MYLCLANCYAGRFHPFSPCEYELSLTFGRRITPGSRETIGEVRCDWETVNDFLEVLPRSTEYCSQGESLINQAATRRLVQGATVGLPTDRAEICDWSGHGRIRRSSFQ